MNLLKQIFPARLAAAGMAMIMAAVVAGCGSTSAGSTGSDSTSTAKKTITLAAVSGWTADIAVMRLYKAMLEPKGYTVNIKELSEISTVYAGTAKGDLDGFPGPIERTQKVYWDQYQNKLEDLNSYYDNLAIFFAVPDYVTEVQSITDLPANASKFDGKIFGIEPGSGLTKMTQDTVFPAYGLGDSYKLQTSSTTAMLTELKKATDAKEPVVVTMWSPYWATSVFPVRALKDPKESFGKPEGVHTVVRKGFSTDFPDAAEMMKNTKLNDAQYASLEDTMVNKFPAGQEQEGVKAWLDQNPDVASAMEKYLTS